MRKHFHVRRSKDKYLEFYSDESSIILTCSSIKLKDALGKSKSDLIYRAIKGLKNNNKI